MVRFVALALAAAAALVGCRSEERAALERCRSGDLAGCRRACHLGVDQARACLLGADLARAASPPDTGGAIRLLDKGCDRQNATACARAAQALSLGALTHETGARRYLERLSRACEYGGAESCRHVGELTLAAARKNGLAALEKYCGRTWTGARRASCLARYRDRAKYLDGLSRRCAEGDARRCEELGAAYGPFDAPTALGAFARACRARGLETLDDGWGPYNGPRLPAKRIAYVAEELRPCARYQLEQAWWRRRDRRGFLGGSGAAAPRGRAIIDADAVTSEPPIADLARVVSALDARRASIERCYRRGLGREPGLRGRVVARFVVDRLGETHRLSSAGSTLSDEAVVGCVLDAVRGATLPPAGEVLPAVVVPIDFTVASR